MVVREVHQQKLNALKAKPEKYLELQ